MEASVSTTWRSGGRSCHAGAEATLDVVQPSAATLVLHRVVEESGDGFGLRTAVLEDEICDRDRMLDVWPVRAFADLRGVGNRRVLERSREGGTEMVARHARILRLGRHSAARLMSADTSVIVRYLVGTPTGQAKRAAALIDGNMQCRRPPAEEDKT